MDEGKSVPISSAIESSKNDINVTGMSYELQQASRIVGEIMSEVHSGINQPFMNCVEEDEFLDKEDYYQVIKKPMWLKKIKENFSNYRNITQVVSDLRLTLENCYRYYGPDHATTKKGVKLEMIMEQKLALLPRDLRDKTSLEVTSGKTIEELRGVRRKSMRLGGGETSIILHQVRHEKSLRDKELRKRHSLEKKAEKQGKEKDVLEWEEQLLQHPLKTQMKASWELPQIGHFLYLCQRTLNTPEVPQYELERALLMPREAALLAKIMTSLLSSPNQRSQLDKKPPMSYRVWSEKLKLKIQPIYKYYISKNKDSQIVFDHLGIEPLFFKILGENNPLDDKPFHELIFRQRIWLLKSLCDYILHNHKTIQDEIAEQPFLDQRDYILGTDNKGNRYLHFPQFCGQDLRIYRQCKWSAPKLEIPAPVIKLEKQRKLKRKLKDEAKLRESRSAAEKKANCSTARPSRLRQNVKSVVKLNSSDNVPKNVFTEDSDSETEDETDHYITESIEFDINHFELVVDSVESLRKLVKDFSVQKGGWKAKKRMNGSSKRISREAALLERLNNLLLELEPWEAKLQQATKKLRNKLHKEWLDYQAKQNKKEPDEESQDEWSDEGGEIKENDDKMEDNKSSSITDDDEDDDQVEEEIERKKRKVEIKKKHGLRSRKVEDVKLANGATKGLLLSHQQQNTASQAKQLFAWETLRQILVNPQKNEETESKESGESEKVMTDTIQLPPSVPACLPTPQRHQSLVSKRQSTLSIQLPKVRFFWEPPPTPSPRPQLTPSTPRISSPSSTQNQQVLTLASNSGTPKFLADKVGPDAQFMHFQLGSPTSKKNCTSFKMSPVDKTVTKTDNTKPMSPDNQKLLLIPAVTGKGDTVYLKIAAAEGATPAKQLIIQGSPSTNTQNSPISKSPVQILSQPPPLAPIGSGPKLRETSPVRAPKSLGQPPPLAQIYRPPTSPIEVNSNRQTQILNTSSAGCSTTTDSKSKLVLLRSGETQMFGMVLENGNVVPLNMQIVETQVKSSKNN